MVQAESIPDAAWFPDDDPLQPTIIRAMENAMKVTRMIAGYVE